MGLYRSIKRVIPDEWKIKVHSTRALLADTAVRAWEPLRCGIQLPPEELIRLVSGHSRASGFLKGGRLASETIRGTLAKNGIEIEHLGAVLDFGCGAGRIMRHWRSLRHPVLHGTDYNPALVEWCRDHLKFAEFRVNTLSGRLPYAPETFDFVYAFSVFTHLSEPLQSFWMGELSRVLKPGGHIWFTTHGEYYLPWLSAEEKEAFLEGRLVVREAERAGSNMCATFHPATYVRENMARDFAAVDFIPGGVEGAILHDIHLLRRAPP